MMGRKKYTGREENGKKKKNGKVRKPLNDI